MAASHLSPDRHKQLEFFVADIFDAAPKDDMGSMEHPLFALKAGDKRLRTYAHGEKKAMIRPGYDGCATIHDKDVWIFCISQLVAAMNKGREGVSRTVRFKAYDLLRSTNRQLDGDSYRRLRGALRRLKGTTIETNFLPSGEPGFWTFGLIEDAKIIKDPKDPKRMAGAEVILPEWLYNQVLSKNVLTLNRDYFRLRKPVDRRLYELARKHCGSQNKWKVDLKLLHTKSGSTAPLREFRRAVKALAESNELPDYHLTFNIRDDSVTFYCVANGPAALLLDALGSKARGFTHTP